MARQGVGLRLLERFHEGQRDPRHRRRMRRAAEGASRGGRAEAHLRAVPLRDGTDRNHCPRNHTATEEQLAEGNHAGWHPMTSLFELFKIGIGPSSSHTIGPMKAAASFQHSLLERREAPHVARIRVTLFGSLAWTGKGHSTEKAIVLGLAGLRPETIDPDEAERRYAAIKESRQLPLTGERRIAFDVSEDIVFDLE